MDQARSHLSPKGGQSPALFAGDWPPAGAPASGNADAEGEAGSAIACGALAGLWRGFGGLLADPVEAPRAGPGEVELAVSEAGLRSLPAQQQAPKALPYGRQFPPTWSSRPAGIARPDRARAVTIQGYCVVGLLLVTASMRSCGRWLARLVARAM